MAAALHKVERARVLSKWLTETTAKDTLGAIPGPGALQAGVVRYYKTAGLMP